MAQIIIRMKCISNLHAGSGDVNYNIIDNEVERDPVTGFPTINSSGVKGALREYFTVNAPELVADIFGADKSGDTSAGKLKFLAADMLAMPVRASAGGKAYYLATSETALARYKELRREFLNSVTAEEKADCGAAEMEGVKPACAVRFPFGDLMMVTDEQFRTFALPVTARNCLEDGRSTNLWYEEVVPHESIFVFPVLAYESDKELLDKFAQTVEGKIVQFGGNASIGYGLCKLEVER